MGWFNVLKGAYPSLQQIDKTLDLDAGETGIVRGSLMYESTTAKFKLANAADATDSEKYLYFCLQPQTDLVAGMAGSIGQGTAKVWTGGTTVVSAGVARVTGLAVGMPFEFETDQFVADTYHIGQLLTVADGGLLADHTSGDNCVAQVTKAVFSRWVNDAVAITGWRTGANVNVLTARTLWVPLLTT